MIYLLQRGTGIHCGSATGKLLTCATASQGGEELIVFGMERLLRGADTLS